MIATLTGVVAEKTLEEIVLDINGVGYGLLVTAEDYGRLASGDSAKLYVHEHIRENSHDLFGFLSLDTKQLFELLLGVTGVGPKVAVSVLNTGNSASVRAAIASGDVKSIQQASGVGKRVAERIVVELKDKVGLEGVDLSMTGMLQSDANLLQDEAVEALVSLGYTAADASAALASVAKDLPTEDRIKQALKVRH
ncbi:MAG TPA: Holliday junction branch migration protein RuvA [Candidatus Pristimantibacillus sp.]|jgi:Holliday junction DNA helicase RuvA|nr:Holliday junction branch migration protein RuvA [Candidatus Pristimantibacillus sp.]